MLTSIVSSLSNQGSLKADKVIEFVVWPAGILIVAPRLILPTIASLGAAAYNIPSEIADDE